MRLERDAVGRLEGGRLEAGSTERTTVRSVGILHPGEMGVTVAARARDGGARVFFASAGRSPATLARAEAAGLEDAGSLERLCERANLLIAVCPPANATELAGAVARAGYRGLYVDANAVDPDTARRIAAIVEGAGARCVDGGIIGPPATRAGTTRLVLSGAAAAEVAEVFAASHLEAIVLEGGAGVASALKMAYAAYTEGSSALLLAVRALARKSGVEAALLEEWARSQPRLEALSKGMARATGPKAWRFEAEMHEIAQTFEQFGLPGDFHRGAAAIYRALSDLKGQLDTDLEVVLESLTRTPELPRAEAPRTQRRPRTEGD